MVLIIDVALVQQHRKIPAHFQHPQTQITKCRLFSPHGQMFQTVQVDSKFFYHHLFLFPGFTLSSGPLGSSVALCLSQSVGLILDQIFWQSGSEVIRIGCVALSASNITPPELHFTPCFSTQPSPLGVQAHLCWQVKEDPTTIFHKS